MFRSLRTTLLVASLLWTAGLLALMHMLSIALMHVYPAVTKVPHHAAVALGLVLMAGGVACLRAGLARFSRLREQLLAVRAHRARRVEGPYPSELKPLVDDLNGLLDDREKAVSRARAAAGDLAHGLKTPLALLTAAAAQARDAGRRDLADATDREVERMSRQVEYHLMRARAAASATTGSAPLLLAPCVDAVARTALKLHAARALEFHSDVSAGVRVRVQADDLEEMLGNLLDNACKWAARRVQVRCFETGSGAEVCIDDDGPGIPPRDRAAALGRGVRLDEASPGSGLGLAIVRDLAGAYGFSVELQESPLGGLRARLTFPASAKM